jgi:hypothetical protein
MEVLNARAKHLTNAEVAKLVQVLSTFSLIVLFMLFLFAFQDVWNTERQIGERNKNAKLENLSTVLYETTKYLKVCLFYPFCS